MLKVPLQGKIRVALGSAPWMTYTLWAGATVMASIIANGLPINRDGKMMPPPLAQLKDELIVEPPAYMFGEGV